MLLFNKSLVLNLVIPIILIQDTGVNIPRKLVNESPQLNTVQ